MEVCLVSTAAFEECNYISFNLEGNISIKQEFASGLKMVFIVYVICGEKIKVCHFIPEVSTVIVILEITVIDVSQHVLKCYGCYGTK